MRFLRHAFALFVARRIFRLFHFHCHCASPCALRCTPSRVPPLVICRHHGWFAALWFMFLTPPLPWLVYARASRTLRTAHAPLLALRITLCARRVHTTLGSVHGLHLPPFIPPVRSPYMLSISICGLRYGGRGSAHTVVRLSWDLSIVGCLAIAVWKVERRTRSLARCPHNALHLLFTSCTFGLLYVCTHMPLHTTLCCCPLFLPPPFTYYPLPAFHFSLVFSCYFLAFLFFFLFFFLRLVVALYACVLL